MLTTEASIQIWPYYFNLLGKILIAAQINSDTVMQSIGYPFPFMIAF